METYIRWDDIIETVRYPSGETHVMWREQLVFQSPSPVVIEVRARSWEDIMNVLTVQRMLDRWGLHVTWFIPFLPFARDDRRRTPFCGNELDLVLDLLKGLSVVIADPHSYVSEILRHIPQSSTVEVFKASAFRGDPLVVIPDEGASKKARTWSHGTATIQAVKERDPHNGMITHIDVPDSPLIKGRDVVIVDDICDGGGTFIGLAQSLKTRGARKVRLVVTHGLFTKGVKHLHEGGVDEVYTFDHCVQAHDQWEDDQHSYVVVPYQTLYENGEQR